MEAVVIYESMFGNTAEIARAAAEGLSEQMDVRTVAVSAAAPTDDLLGADLIVIGSPRATEDHPFWNATDKQWQDAQELDFGNNVLTVDGFQIPTSGIDAGSSIVDSAYNLTVDDLHTYYVLAGPVPVLVHNCGTGEIYNEVVEKRIVARHDAGSAETGKWIEKSKLEDWVTRDDIRSWARSAMKKPVEGLNTQMGPRHQRILKFDEPLGYDKDLNDLFRMAVWVEDGAVASLYPMQR